MDSVSIGLDIGSCAVRAVEMEVKDDRPTVKRYAQVGIPTGWVVDGEVVNITGVGEAVKRLWAEGGFTSNKVILGVSGPRVFVRQADVPAMDREDLRSSLRFDGQEMVPIALDEASFDFSVLDHIAVDPGEGGSEGRAPKMRILLVAAHRDVLSSYLEVLRHAGLTAVAMDSSALALLRAVPVLPTPEGSSGVEVLVSIGAELTLVAVRRNGVPLFIRSLSVGGARLTRSIADSMHMELAVAERVKRGAVPPGTPQMPQARRAMSGDIRDLAEDVRATVDFFLAQADGSTIDRLLVTGGASQTAGLAEAIAGNLPCQVLTIAPFGGLPTDGLDFDEPTLARAASTATTAVGLALWPTGSPLIRLSILPEEIAKQRQIRRIRGMAVVGVCGVAALLGVAGAAKVWQVRSAEHQTKVANEQVARLTSQVTQLQAQTAVHGEVQSRAALEVAALKGDVDWVRFLAQLASVMPSQVSISSFSGTRVAGTTGSTGSVGTVTFSVSGPGDAKDAAQWIQGLHRDPALQGTWVSGISISGQNGKSTAAFSSTANLTTTSQSNRWEEVHP